MFFEISQNWKKILIPFQWSLNSNLSLSISPFSISPDIPGVYFFITIFFYFNIFCKVDGLVELHCVLNHFQNYKPEIHTASFTVKVRFQFSHIMCWNIVQNPENVWNSINYDFDAIFNEIPKQIFELLVFT